MPPAADVLWQSRRAQLLKKMRGDPLEETELRSSSRERGLYLGTGFQSVVNEKEVGDNFTIKHYT